MNPFPEVITDPNVQNVITIKQCKNPNYIRYCCAPLILKVHKETGYIYLDSVFKHCYRSIPIRHYSFHFKEIFTVKNFQSTINIIEEHIDDDDLNARMEMKYIPLEFRHIEFIPEMEGHPWYFRIDPEDKVLCTGYHVQPDFFISMIDTIDEDLSEIFRDFIDELRSPNQKSLNNLISFQESMHGEFIIATLSSIMKIIRHEHKTHKLDDSKYLMLKTKYKGYYDTLNSPNIEFISEFIDLYKSVL
jgi:hypothetical protein